MIFSTDKDGDESSKFHCYCDGIVPTVTVVIDTEGRRFGGYSTQSWAQYSCGSSARAPESFIFNLSNQKKCELIDQLDTCAVEKSNSFGPKFGRGHDLYIFNKCKSTKNNYCKKCSYNSGDTNLLGGKEGETYFTVKTYEVYQVIFD